MDKEIKERIRIENIRARVEASDWQSAVRAAGKILEDAGSATNEYTESMVSAVEELGPYMVISPGLAIAHAAPSAAVIKNDNGILNLETPVNFGCANDPVSVVLVVCCTDRQSHLQGLRSIAEALIDEAVVGRLAKAETVGELYDVING